MVKITNQKGYKDKDKRVGDLSWVNINEEGFSPSLNNKETFKTVFKEDSISNVLVNKYLPSFGIFMLAYGLPLFIYASSNVLGEKGYEIAITIAGLITLYLVVATLIPLLMTLIMGDSLEEETILGLKASTVVYGMALFITVFTQPILYLVRYLNLIIQGEKGYIRKQVEKTFSKNEEDVLEMLNKKVELPNGFITYFNNILTTTHEGIYPTIKYKELDETKEEDRLKVEVVEGEELTSETLPNYFKLMYNDYKQLMLDKLYKETKEIIEDKGKKRQKELEYISQQKGVNVKRGQEVSEYLTREVRENRLRDIKVEIELDLNTLNKQVEDIKNLQLKTTNNKLK